MKRAIPVTCLVGVILCTAFLLLGVSIIVSNLPHSKSIGFPVGTKTALIKAAEGAEVKVQDGAVHVLAGSAGSWDEPVYNWRLLGLTFGIPFAFIVSVAVVQCVLSLRRAITLGNHSMA